MYQYPLVYIIGTLWAGGREIIILLSDLRGVRELCEHVTSASPYQRVTSQLDELLSKPDFN